MFVVKRAIGSIAAFGSGYLVSHGFVSETHSPVKEQRNEVVDKIRNSDLYKQLAADKQFKQGSLSSAVPTNYRENHVGLGLLYGKQLFEIDPIFFLNKETGEMTSFHYIGDKLQDNDGKLHKGVLGLLLDEGLCFSGFPKLPNGRGVTGRLSIDYLKDNRIKDETLVVRAKVKEAKGRRVSIEGHVETLEKKPQVLAKASCLLVEPKWFKYFTWMDLFKA